MKRNMLTYLLLLVGLLLKAQPQDYVWTSPGTCSQESMPVGGGSIGMNVWMEQGDIVLYVSHSGAFDENNTLLKAGRIRIKLTPVLNASSNRFRETLHLYDGYLTLNDGDQKVTIWADVWKSVVHIEIKGSKPVKVEARYENWRTIPRPLDGKEGQQCSYKWTAKNRAVTTADHQAYSHNRVGRGSQSVTFYHQNPLKTVFDVSVHQQGLDAVASQLYNPLTRLISGGRLSGMDDSLCKYHHIQMVLHNHQGSVEEWNHSLTQIEQQVRIEQDRKASRQWWHEFWQRSYIHTDAGDYSEICRNYTLFRYLLGCNAHSDWPTKFNGSLFTFDPEQIDSTCKFTPDFRKWGGGTFTAQNQRLVYWPMLATGDGDLMQSQFDFYKRLLPTAELRTHLYWHHPGACFAEQIENYGLPNPAEYGMKRPAPFDPGVEYNAWLEYEWDTVLEFCQMILLSKSYFGADITSYLPLIQRSIQFFDEHYRQLARQRGRKELDGTGHLILYPGSACETYKMTYNAVSTVAALQTLLRTYINEVDSSLQWKEMLQRIPPIPLRQVGGYEMIAPAQAWERVQNIETPQLYPVFPWRIYGIGRKNLDVGRNTYFHDSDALKFRSSKGWKQDNIWAACLGLTDEADRLTQEKLSNGPYRFPAFWGPGYDWSPDFNHGGSGMMGLQMMLLQDCGDQIILFPAWDAKRDVSFKLHAPQNTIVEAVLKNGKLTQLLVTPKNRSKDIIIMNKDIK